MIDIFARNEKKYVITKQQYRELLQRIRPNLIEDQYSNYQICNIYYDTEQYDLFRLSADKPFYKEKLRVRSYGTPTLQDEVFVEVKKKFNGTVYKRRIELTLQKAYDFIAGKLSSDSVNAKELLYLLQRYNLQPKVYLSYYREAFVWKTDNNVRITFDTNLKFRTEAVGLENGDEGELLIPEDTVLLEIKALNSLPLEFVKALSELQIYPQSFSKIGTVYKTKILPSIKKGV